MTWRLEVVHTTTYSYSSPVLSSYNEVRMTPITDLHQTTGNISFTIDPRAPIRRYWDYWGTQVIEFDITEPHDRLVLTSTAAVETEEAKPPVRAATWEDLWGEKVRDVQAELLAPTPYTAHDDELAVAAKDFAAAHADPVDAVLAVMAWVNDSLTYQSGVTGVHTSAAEAWQARRGVCQDFAHVALVVLRAMGVPARYVSGYLHSKKNPEIGTRTKGESHAWVEAWTGDWWGYDPTNNVEVGHRHVGVARGRDYADVAPVRGVHSGGGAATLDVEVTLTRLR
ncbi:MAG: transglutaminase family protein [Frankiaceae bacterium]|nr:transglutaminase family protein [Frankiaceae bacterium]MBV9870821.1 transglutaminase family protein [Frankiaceae bacterium]